MRLTFRTASTALVCFALLTACGDDDGGTDSGMLGMDAGPRDSSVPVCETTGPEDNAAACMDACDNDDDGAADCDDFGCCSVRSDCPATSECGSIGDGGMVMPCATEGPESTLAACSDGCDNDGNSFADCNDFDCCDARTDCPATTACGRPVDGGMATTYTIAQLQNRADPMHPMPGARVTVDQAGMVALTGRVLVGSATGGAAGTCRFSIWVGNAVTDDFTAILVQELIPLGAAESCFDLPVGKISDEFAPGDAVTSIANATYSEFCAGPMPNPSPCTDFEQSSIFLGGSATITRGAPGTAPTPTVVEVAELVGAAGAPGSRAVALEGGLLRVEDVRISVTLDGTFMRYSAYAADAPTVELDLVVSNFPNTMCVRTELTRLAAGTDTATITGVLVPNFGRWSLRLRGEGDIDGLTCTPAP